MDISQPDTLDGKFTGIFEKLALSMGKMPGYDWIDKYGTNLAITTATDPEDLWEQGGIYTYSTTSDVDTLSSNNPLDTNILIEIRGISSPTSDGETYGYASLNGQNKVNIYSNKELTGDPITFWRVYRLTNISTKYLTGICYCYVDTAISGGVPTDITKIKAIIDNGYGETRMALFTVPPKKVSIILKAEGGLQFSGLPSSGPDYARMSLGVRPYEGIFTYRRPVTFMFPGNTIYQLEPHIPLTLPALTDIKLRIEEVSSTLGVWGDLTILIVDENKFASDFLAKIGQPGY